MQSSESYDENDKLNFRSIDVWDTSRGLLMATKSEEWNRFWCTKKSTSYSYNGNGFLIKATDNDAKDNAYQVTELTNDADGNPIELILYGGNGNSYGREFAKYYFDKNKCVTSVTSTDGRVLSIDTITISFINAYEFYNPYKIL
jgi:hypothetical protein